MTTFAEREQAWLAHVWPVRARFSEQPTIENGIALRRACEEADAAAEGRVFEWTPADEERARAIVLEALAR